MDDKEVIDQLNDLIEDRRSFLTGDKDNDVIF